MNALGVEGISASSVSRITKELDEKVCEFISKSIEHEIPYLFVDATYLKVRDGLHYENQIAGGHPTLNGLSDNYR
jgi:putative transposase